MCTSLFCRFFLYDSSNFFEMLAHSVSHHIMSALIICYLFTIFHTRDEQGHHDHEAYYGDRDTDSLVTVRTH